MNLPFLRLSARRVATRALLFTMSCCLLSSCDLTERTIEGSADAARQRYTGPSYPNSSFDAADFGLNITMGIYMPINPNSGHPGFGLNGPTIAAPSGNVLYASLAPMSPYEARQSLNADPTTKKKAPSFLDNVYLMAGPEIVLKNSTDGGTKIRTGYLQLPVFGLYRYKLPGSAGAVFAGLGPYFAYGLWGKLKSSYGSEDAFGANTFRRVDAGLGLMAGYQLPAGYYARIGYEIGLVNIDHDQYDHAKMRNFYVALGVPLSKLGLGK